MKKEKLMKDPQKHSLLKLVLTFIKTNPVFVTIAFVCIILAAISQSVSGIVVRPIVNGAHEVASGTLASETFMNDTLMPSVYMLLISGVIGVICSFASTILMSYVGQYYLDSLRKTVFNHMESLPLFYFDSNKKGDIMSTYTNDIDTIRQFIVQTIQVVINCILVFIVLLATMLAYSVYLSLIVLVAVIIMAIAAKNIGSKAGKSYFAQQKAIAEQEGLIEEMMGGLKVVKSFNHEVQAEEQFKEYNGRLQKASTDASIYANKMAPVLTNIGYICYVLVVLTGTLMICFQGYNYGFSTGVALMDLGTIIAFIPLVQQCTGTVNSIGQQVNFITLAQAGSKRIGALLAMESEVDDGYVDLVRGNWEGDTFVESINPKKTDGWAWKHPHQADGSITYTPLKGDITMNDVDFAYEPGKTVLHNISLYAKPGQKVAFVGSTGAGKTTITNLLNRFYDIADGKIRYDGININKIKKSALRQSLGMVLQDTSLFTGTIYDNIRFGRLDATDEECIEAAKLVNADSFIRMLPNGYDTVIEGDGSSLSQGQCQLLSIARAAINNPPVLILDEATSSIDTRTEALVMDGMDKLMQGRTVFAIAHRLSTVRNSNVIIVLDHGCIKEKGDHEQLLLNKGLYYQLYTGTTELE